MEVRGWRCEGGGARAEGRSRGGPYLTLLQACNASDEGNLIDATVLRRVPG